MREITYAQAINEAMCEEMHRDPDLYFLGEDIGVYRGAFGVSGGMLEEFGPGRVVDAPISETAIIGCAIGSAITGTPAIAELMFSDFMAVCFDQIINQAAKIRYMSGGKLEIPIVIRTPSGGGTGAAAQHSQSLETMLAHVPGLYVAVPSTPYDAKGLLKSAVRDRNPVVFLEQKLLYRRKGEVPEGEYTIPLGLADIKRQGDDCTIVTYGRMVHFCMEAAQRLEGEGISAEVVDLRTLYPLDRQAIIDSVKKTQRVLIVHEAVKFCGFGAEVAGIVAESEAFFYLEAPITRLGAKYAPIPFNPALERGMFPSPESIYQAVKGLF